MERHLCNFVNYQQDNWLEKLAMAEFATNNNESASTKLFTFFATKGLYARISFDIVELSDASIYERIFKQKVLDISGNIETTSKFARKAIAVVQKSQLKQTDKHQNDISYTVGDKVGLSTRNITTNQPFKKLDYKILGFFTVIKNKKASVELQLPQCMKIYNVFHLNLLQKTSKDRLTNQVNKPPPLVIINNKKKWEVEDILDARSY